jgi:transposase InsO family protein
MVLGGQTPKAVSEAIGVCPRTVRKWVDRFKAEGLAGLRDRSSRPDHLRQPTPQATVDRIEALRRQRLTGKAIAAETGVSPATVSRVLKHLGLRHLGLNRLSALEPAEPPRRYQRERPGELIHIDIKKLGRFDRTGHRITGRQTGIATSRGSGWEFVHACPERSRRVCIDDASRIAFSRVIKTERKACAVAFLEAAVTYYTSLACRRLGLKLIYTKPYTPRTNGKAERFIQTALREWAYARVYDPSLQRAAELPYWIHRYNWHRPHGSIGAVPPLGH